MRRIASVVGEHLDWSQPSMFKMEYELRSGGSRVATLVFRSSFGSLATARSADSSWTFKRVGFIRTRVTIRERREETDLACFRNNTWAGGGTLDLADGRQYRATTNFWQTKLEFQDESEKCLVAIRRGVLGGGAEAWIEPSAATIPELPWITLLAWYLTVMMQLDSDAGGG